MGSKNGARGPDGRSLTSTSVPRNATGSSANIDGPNRTVANPQQAQLHMHHLQDLLLERRKLNRRRSVSLLQEMLQGSKAFLRIPNDSKTHDTLRQCPDANLAA